MSSILLLLDHLGISTRLAFLVEVLDLGEIVSLRKELFECRWVLAGAIPTARGVTNFVCGICTQSLLSCETLRTLKKRSSSRGDFHASSKRRLSAPAVLLL